MEYTIYSESLVHYCLRNKDGYLSFDCGHYKISNDMIHIQLFGSLKHVKEFKDENESIYGPLQIRKIKVIDIGEVNG